MDNDSSGNEAKEETAEGDKTNDNNNNEETKQDSGMTETVSKGEDTCPSCAKTISANEPSFRVPKKQRKLLNIDPGDERSICSSCYQQAATTPNPKYSFAQQEKTEGKKVKKEKKHKREKKHKKKHHKKRREKKERKKETDNKQEDLESKKGESPEKGVKENQENKKEDSEQKTEENNTARADKIDEDAVTKDNKEDDAKSSEQPKDEPAKDEDAGNKQSDSSSSDEEENQTEKKAQNGESEADNKDNKDGKTEEDSSEEEKSDQESKDANGNSPSQVEETKPMQSPQNTQSKAVETGPCRGLLDTYKSFCEDCRTEPNGNLIQYLEALDAMGDRHLDLYQPWMKNVEILPGMIYTHCNPLTGVPVAIALNYNKYFRAFSLRDIKKKDILPKISLALENNKTLTKLALSSLEAESGYAELGAVLKKTMIMDLDLSNNIIKEKGINALAPGINCMRYLTKLNLSHCKLNPACIQTLMKALSNRGFNHLFVELNLSNNNIGTVGCQAIASWIGITKVDESHKEREEKERLKFGAEPTTSVKSSLKKLILSSCQLDATEIFNALSTSYFRQTLQVVDISDNKLTGKNSGIDSIINFIKQSSALSHLNLSSCSLTPKAIVDILSTFGETAALKDVRLDLADNNLGPLGGSTIAIPLTSVSSIGSISFRSNALKKEGVLSIAKSIFENHSITELDLSENKLSKGGGGEYLMALAALVSGESTLKKINLSSMDLGKDLAAVLKDFSNNQSMTEADISNNGGGDQMLAILSEALSKNNTLLTLHYDHNATTISGWSSLASSLKTNKIIRNIVRPEADINKVLSSASSKERERTKEKVNEVMSDIDELCKRNIPKPSAVKDIGLSDEQNPVWRETMEDESCIIDGFGGQAFQAYFAVYDGHGGRDVAKYVRQHLHQNVLSELQNAGDDPDMSKVLQQAYAKTDQQITEQHFKTSGATSASVLLRKNAKGEKWLHAANLGDARAVLCRNGQAARLTYDHKATDEAETKRITEANGLLVFGRVGGTLAISRAFGDTELKKYGLCTDPYLSHTLLQPTDTILIVACDGLWDVVTDQQAVDLIKNETTAQKMSDSLLYYALDNGTRDNVTIMVIVL